MAQEFASRADCAEYLRGMLGSSPFGEEVEAPLIAELVDGFVDVCEEGDDDSAKGFKLKFGRWVVRDDDLKLFTTFKDAMLALSPAGFALHQLSASTATSLAFALASGIRNAYRFSGKVDAAQARILAVMKHAARPMTTTEILGLVKPSLPEAWDGAYDEGSVEHALKGLEAIPTPNGPAKFVVKLNDGRWTLNGISVVPKSVHRTSTSQAHVLHPFRCR